MPPTNISSCSGTFPSRLIYLHNLHKLLWRHITRFVPAFRRLSLPPVFTGTATHRLRQSSGIFGIWSGIIINGILRPLVCTNFIFSCSTQYLTTSLRSLVRYWVQHSKIKLISTRLRVMSSIYLLLCCKGLSQVGKLANGWACLKESYNAMQTIEHSLRQVGLTILSLVTLATSIKLAGQKRLGNFFFPDVPH